jgi:hypothetical protein
MLLPTNHSGMESRQSARSKGLFPHTVKGIDADRKRQEYSHLSARTDSLSVSSNYALQIASRTPKDQAIIPLDESSPRGVVQTLGPLFPRSHRERH